MLSFRARIVALAIATVALSGCAGCAVVGVVGTTASLAVSTVSTVADVAIGAGRVTAKVIGAGIGAVTPGPSAPPAPATPH
jgi:hypothetical protein